MPSSPLVSVVMASYNHARFVRQAMESVLAQEGVDFEFLIEDDGSSDGTAAIIQERQDNRIRFFPKVFNEGACTTVNHLISESRGEFIALINSDDAWFCTDKLSYQLEILLTNPNVGACFGRAAYMDATGQALDKDAIPYGHIFDEPNHTKSAWLRRFFLWGNCICHPTMMIRKACYEQVGLYDNRFRQVPDFEMWTRIIKYWDIHISERELVTFRLIEGENTSAPTSVNSTRLMNEYFFVFSKLFDDVDKQLFGTAFQDIISYPDLPTPEHLDIEKALLFLQPGLWMERVHRLIGLQKIFALLASPAHRTVLRDDYSINDAWLHEQMGASSPFAHYASPSSDPKPEATPAKSKVPFFRYLSFLHR